MTNFKEMCEIVAKKNGDNRYFASLSMGADSIAALLRVKEAGVLDVERGVYYYYYAIPGLDFIDQYLEYIQYKLNIRVITMPSHVITTTMAKGSYLSPSQTYAMDKLQNSQDAFLRIEKSDIANIMRLEAELSPTALEAVGIKQGDSPDRRVFLRKCCGWNENALKWYPIHDFENRDVVEIIKRHGLKMPMCYDLGGISTENVDYRFSEPMRRHYPRGYEQIKKYFGSIDVTRHRIQRYHPEWAEPKKGVFYHKFECLYPDGIDMIPDDKPLKAKKSDTPKESLGMKAFRKLATDRMDFELQLAPYIHFVFKGQKERDVWLKKNGVTLVDGMYTFWDDIESRFNLLPEKVMRFDLDLNLDISLDLNIDLSASGPPVTGLDALQRDIDDELNTKLKIIESHVKSFENGRDGDYYFTCIFEEGAYKDYIIDRLGAKIVAFDIVMM